MNFKPVDDNFKKLLSEYRKDYGYLGSDFSFYGYLSFFDCEYAEDGGVLYIRALFGNKLRYWPPLTKGKSKKEAMQRLPKDSVFTSVTEDIVSEFDDEYLAVTNRAWAEYIYKTEDFIGQVGKKYSAKRNHIKKFVTLYNYSMDAYKHDDLDDILAFEKSWLESKTFENDYQEESSKEESRLIIKEIEASLNGETICDVLRIDGKLVGFTVGEIINDVAIVSVEKADISYEGIYSFLSHEFAKRNFQNTRYINRQEDMGMEGLRKSKLSYNPEFLLDKYTLIPRDQKDNLSDFTLLQDSLENAYLIVSNDIPQTIQEKINQASLQAYEIRELKEYDYTKTMEFLKCEISHLKDKKFFLNYKDEELMQILRDGHLFGAFFDGVLVATCGVDMDKEYGNELAEICSDNEYQYYEFSGIFVSRLHRNKGLANYLCSYVLNFAKQNLTGSKLCAVVQYNNIPSLNNLKKLGFEEKSQKILGEYNFKYLTILI